jgi:hypothetical protein
MDTVYEDQLDQMLYARHAEIKSIDDLQMQRGTPIPALFNTFYKFIQNPSSVSIETYKRMIDTDDTIGSGVDFLTTCLAARMGSYQHKSKEVTEFVNRALEQIDGGWHNAMKELLSASWAGFAVQEQVWKNHDDMGFIVDKLVTLPPSTLLFETERTGELTADGILQYQRNYNPAFAAGGVSYLFGFSVNSLSPLRNYSPDPYAKLGDFPFPLRTANSYSYMSIRIPRAKVIHYSFDAQGKFGNPYGRSLLRRAYKYYVMKDAFLKMLATALDRKGTPLTIVYADPNATLRDPAKAGDANVGGQRGMGIRADVAARNAFKNIHNDSVIILPGKKDQVYSHDVINHSSNANDFIESLRFCNQSIMRALLLPALVFSGGDGSGSFALGQEHAKTFDKILDGMLSGFKQVLIDQHVQRLIKFNFPETVWKKDGFGDFTKRELSQDEVQKEMESIERGVNMGAIDMADLNDLNTVRDKLGFEAKDKPIKINVVGVNPADMPDEVEDEAPESDSLS